METKSKAVVLFRLMQISQDPECFSKYSELLRAWIQNSVTFEEMDRKAQCLVPAESHSKFLLQMCEEANIDITLSESEGPSNNLFPTAMTLRASLIISACEHQVIEAIDDYRVIVDNILLETRSIISSIIEAALKTTRPFLTSEDGFCHSFGIQQIKPINNGTEHQLVISPQKEPITIRDVLDAMKFYDDAIPNGLQRANLLKLLEKAQKVISKPYVGNK